MNQGMRAFWFLLPFVLVGVRAQMTRFGGIRPPITRRGGMPDPPLQNRRMTTFGNPPGNIMGQRVAMNKPMSPLSKMTSTAVMLGNDAGKRSAALQYMNNECVATRPAVKALLMDYMDVNPLLAAGGAMGNPLLMGFGHLSDNMKRAKMVQEIRNQCVGLDMGLSMLLSDIVDLPIPLMAMGPRGR